MNENRVKYLLIGKDVALTTSGTINDISDLTDGGMAVVDEFGTAYANGDGQDSTTKLRIVVRNGSKLVYSPFFKGANVISAASEADVAAVQKIAYIGYTGANSAGINVVNSAVYSGKIDFIEVDASGQGSVNNMKDFVYKSDSSATQDEIVNGIHASLINNFSRDARKDLQFDRVCSAAVTAANCFDNDATVVTGTKLVTVATNLQYNSGAGTAVAGDYIRLTGPSASATALTSSIYKITEVISTTTFMVDQPINEASGTYAAADDELEVIPAATIATTASSGYFGVKVTGQARAWENAKVSKYSLVNFNIILDEEGFESTPVTATQAAVLPSGYGAQIADLEAQLLGNEGNEYRGDFLYSASRNLVTDTTAYYDVMTLEFYDDSSTGGLTYVRSPYQIYVAAPEAGASSNFDMANIIAVLDDCFSFSKTS